LKQVVWEKKNVFKTTQNICSNYVRQQVVKFPRMNAWITKCISTMKLSPLLIASSHKEDKNKKKCYCHRYWGQKAKQIIKYIPLFL
jgi:hypothetical protein